MQKWEYLTFYSAGNYYEINGGDQVKYKPNETLHMILNQFGTDGWELVSQPNNNIWTFKRPLN